MSHLARAHSATTASPQKGKDVVNVHTAKLLTAALVVGIRPAGYYRNKVKTSGMPRKDVGAYLDSEIQHIKRNFSTALVGVARGRGAETGVVVEGDFIKAVHDKTYRAAMLSCEGPSAERTAAAITSVYEDIDASYATILESSKR